MKTAFYYVILVTLLLGAAPSAFARSSSFSSSGDMFYDLNWVYDRPEVPSDRTRRNDMFAPVPVMFHANADLFDNAKPKVTYGREDMLPHLPIERQRPYHVLTIDPRQGPYDVR